MTEKKKILIIDDEQDLTFLMSEALSLNDKYEVFVAHDGLKGQEMAVKVMPDVVFLDFVMPKIKGDKVLQYITENVGSAKDVEVVIMSGLGTEVYFQETDRHDTMVDQLQKDRKKEIIGGPSAENFSSEVVNKYGVRYSLPKPFTQEALIAIVKKILNG